MSINSDDIGSIEITHTVINKNNKEIASVALVVDFDDDVEVNKQQVIKQLELTSRAFKHFFEANLNG